MNTLSATLAESAAQLHTTGQVRFVNLLGKHLNILPNGFLKIMIGPSHPRIRVESTYAHHGTLKHTQGNISLYRTESIAITGIPSPLQDNHCYIVSAQVAEVLTQDPLFADRLHLFATPHDIRSESEMVAECKSLRILTPKK